jgi:hypothetical protein
MLDDDSYPLDVGVHRITTAAPREVGAIGAEIMLHDGAHEAGGLPEVFIGCGVAIRRDLFNELGGYDESFHYYAEEYDLAARILLAGSSVTHHAGWRIMHHKVTTGRDMNAILRNLVRNNLWINQRYTPDDELQTRRDEIITRYKRIAEKESAVEGYEVGLSEGEAALAQQTRTPMPAPLDERFTGLHAARSTLERVLETKRTASICHPGKSAWCVERALRELDIELVDKPTNADARVIATMSPGPILDALASEPPGTLIAPYNMRGVDRRRADRSWAA